MRNWPAALITALQQDDVMPVWLVAMGFDSGTERLHTGVGTLTWAGQTFVGAGSFARVGLIEEGAELSPYALELGLSGIDAEIRAIALAEQYFMRPITVWLGAMDPAGALVVDPGEYFAGYMMQLDLAIGDPEAGDSVTLTCESEAAVIERPRNVRYTEAQLQAEYAGDLGLQYLALMPDAKPQWRGNQQLLTGTQTPPTWNIPGYAY
jgi:hypothetical protein